MSDKQYYEAVYKTVTAMLGAFKKRPLDPRKRAGYEALLILQRESKKRIGA